MQQNCDACQTHLAPLYDKFRHLTARGYSEKDAAVRVLQDPNKTAVPKQCCMVNLITNRNIEGQVDEYTKTKDYVANIREQQATAAGMPPPKRIQAKIYVVDETGSNYGHFQLLQSPVNDIAILAGKYDPTTGKLTEKGLNITNIAQVPQTIITQKGWGKIRSNALWSGEMIMIPVIATPVGVIPGQMMVIEETNPGVAKKLGEVTEGYINREFDNSFIQAEIIGYSEQTVNDSQGRPKTAYIMTVLKEIPSKIIA